MTERTHYRTTDYTIYSDPDAGPQLHLRKNGNANPNFTVNCGIDRCATTVLAQLTKMADAMQGALDAEPADAPPIDGIDSLPVLEE